MTHDTGLFSEYGEDILRAEGGHRLSETFCADCYLATISAGNAGPSEGYGSDERKDLVRMLKQNGGKLNTDMWNPSGCENQGSPLITGCRDFAKVTAVPGIMKYYKDTEGVDIADEDVHFFDDQSFNIAPFEGSGYNAHQVSCATTGGTAGGYEAPFSDKCAASLEEFNGSPGIHYCCSGSAVPPASTSSKTTQCGTPCHFPFTYENNEYQDCTSVCNEHETRCSAGSGNAAPWCATTVNFDNTSWGYCYGGNSAVIV